jgi:hypothetical protein
MAPFSVDNVNVADDELVVEAMPSLSTNFMLLLLLFVLFPYVTRVRLVFPIIWKSPLILYITLVGVYCDVRCVNGTRTWAFTKNALPVRSAVMSNQHLKVFEILKFVYLYFMFFSFSSLE